ncbi:unnamed protein product [Cercospora beticola]|nr:unnamed protein product [Cercospora beticola]
MSLHSAVPDCLPLRIFHEDTHGNTAMMAVLLPKSALFLLASSPAERTPNMPSLRMRREDVSQRFSKDSFGQPGGVSHRIKVSKSLKVFRCGDLDANGPTQLLPLQARDATLRLKWRTSRWSNNQRFCPQGCTMATQLLIC